MYRRWTGFLVALLGFTAISWSGPTVDPGARFGPAEFQKNWNDGGATPNIPKLECAAESKLTTPAVMFPDCDSNGALSSLAIDVPLDPTAAELLVRQVLAALPLSDADRKLLDPKQLAAGNEPPAGVAAVAIQTAPPRALVRTVTLRFVPSAFAMTPPTTTSTPPTTSTTVPGTTGATGGTSTGGDTGRNWLLGIGDYASALEAIAVVLFGTAATVFFVIRAKQKKTKLADAIVGAMDKKIGPI